MATFYAYKPTAKGTAPLGTDGQSIRWDLKTDRGAIRWARAIFGPTVRVFRIVGSFYDDAAHHRIA
jgi:hypothetical protein